MNFTFNQNISASIRNHCYSSMLLIEFTVHGIFQWCVFIVVNVLNQRPLCAVTLSAELEELYVHKTNGGCRRWHPWKMTLPAAYFFSTSWVGWWMVHDSGFRSHTSAAVEIFTWYSSGPVGCHGHPCWMKMFTFLPPWHVTSEPATNQQPNKTRIYVTIDIEPFFTTFYSLAWV